MVELTRIDSAKENVLVGLSSKQPKVVAGSVTALKEIVKCVPVPRFLLATLTFCPKKLRPTNCASSPNTQGTSQDFCP